MNTKLMLSELKPGSVFETELGEFIVLDQDSEYGCTKVITKNLYAENVEFGRTCNYFKSKLRDLMDGEITDKFKAAFGDALLEHEVDVVSVDMQNYGGLKSFVRPITFDEARIYNQHLVNKDLPDWWWTCTPCSTEERGWKYSAAVVCPSGVISSFNYFYEIGVRPFCILKSDIFVSVKEEKMSKLEALQEQLEKLNKEFEAYKKSIRKALTKE